MSELGRLEDLPPDYVAALRAQNLVPLWPSLRGVLPGEWAPSPRHTPNAVRMVVEGKGAWSTVDGEKCAMERGDLILTPTGLWHEHGHDGDEPVVWLDVLDLPLVYYMEASYHVDGGRQTVRPVHGERAYARGGVVPTSVFERSHKPYPMLRYPWADARAALESLAADQPDLEEGAGLPLHRRRNAAAHQARRVRNSRPRSSKLISSPHRNSTVTTTYLWNPPPVYSLPVRGKTERLPVNRIFLVGRNDHAHAVEKGRPRDLGKDVEQSSVVSEIAPMPGKIIDKAALELTVNDVAKQKSDIDKLIWNIPELIADLSRFDHLQPGDLIFTGAPEGVGRIVLHTGPAE